ncbi:GNAT family N-acetyltransferase [Demequina mangrovi]|uniref:Ribosomal-protein-alanine N-acetyltransferase n=1 Tax=Demequina mangrovi TaxID=1043493 RepID=A0A1H6YL51_9MICO|nr:GNAT family protein [Demequina mangrovi]SEJ37455.1 ribosomal-protein-alanine N-acetyltransferase [Demequina mangrovi]
MPSGPVLESAGVRLRALRPRDEAEWMDLRARNREWLRRWEATLPPEAQAADMSFRAFTRLERRQRRELSALPFAIEVDRRLVGRVAVAGIQWGAQRSASLGYWIDEGYTGRGIVTRAAAMAATYAFDIGLHRLEIAIRPENAASRRIAEKLDFTEEGERRSYLFIDGAWRDHLIFARTQDDPRPSRYWDVDG